VEYLEAGIRCLVGVVFLASSLSKLAGTNAYRAFTASVGELRLLPARVTPVVAVTVVVAELAIWLLLAAPVPVAAVAGFMVAAGLLAAFAIGIALSLTKGVRAPCRCFGTSTTPLGLGHVVRNAVLAVISLGGAVIAPLGGPVRPGGFVVAVLAGLFLGVLIMSFDDIVALFRVTYNIR
jgi:hypothetical protein